MIDIQKYVQDMEVLGKCVFQIYNNDFSYKERYDMIKKTLEAYKESRLDAFPYDELADFFSQEISRYEAGFQDYKIDRWLVRLGTSFSVFILDEFREDIEHPAWDGVCKRVQMFFIVFSEVLQAAGRTDKIEQVPNVSYMKTMVEELGIVGKQDEKEDKTSKFFNSEKSVEQLTYIFYTLKEKSFLDEETLLDDWLFVFKGVGKLNSKIKWAAINSRTRMPSKKSLLDFLVLMGFSDKDIRGNINDCFSVVRSRKFSSQDYTGINFHRNVISEYHEQLSEIVKKET